MGAAPPLARALRAERIMQSVGVADLAARMGVSATRVRQIEAKTATPDGVVDRYLAALGWAYAAWAEDWLDLAMDVYDRPTTDVHSEAG